MKRSLYLLIVLLTLIIASCGGAGPTTTLNVTMTDFQFTPNQFTVPAGQEITLNVTNTGAVVHNFIIMNLGTTAGATYEEDDDANVYWQERDIQSGGDFSVTFTAPTEPGEYEVVCRTEGHIASGMVGKLIVVAGE
ncbi:MAG: cupredoxin domain-containing protein [Anaerolineae bacterium]|nr:cupredoxin domain-containing protein [Anaerolineae bacterium]MCI0609713.1 cupredoxin domain-containing protein [Anaerolineae bacterium]